MNCQDILYRNCDPRSLSRRWFLQQCGVGLGAISLAELLGGARVPQRSAKSNNPLAVQQPHYPAKAKSVIFLFMAGAPSHLELFDYKPQLAKFDGTLPPAELLKGYRAAFINPNSKLLGPQVQVRQARPVRGRAVRDCCRTWPASSTTWRSSSRWSPTPSTTRPARS